MCSKSKYQPSSYILHLVLQQKRIFSKVQSPNKNKLQENTFLKVTLMYCQLTNSRMFWDSSLARQMQWLKSLICFLCLSLTLFRLCSNIHSVAFRFAGSALDSSWTSSWQSGTLSDCWQSCWSRDSSDINWCQFSSNISPPLFIPCDWNIYVDRCRSSAVKLTEFVSSILALVRQCWTSSLSLFSTACCRRQHQSSALHQSHALHTHLSLKKRNEAFVFLGQLVGPFWDLEWR